MEWNWLDALLVSVVAISVVAAMWEGFIREMISLASLVAGVALAALEYQRVSEWLRRFTESPEAAKGLAFLALFFGTIAVGAAISFVLRTVVKTAGIAWFDRFFGGIFGLIRGLIVTSVFLLAMVSFSIRPAVVQGSMFAPYVMMGARAIGALMPQDLRSRFRTGLDQFKKSLIEKDKRAPGK